LDFDADAGDGLVKLQNKLGVMARAVTAGGGELGIDLHCSLSFSRVPTQREARFDVSALSFALEYRQQPSSPGGVLAACWRLDGEGDGELPRTP
jgi:hypothetical protein